MKKLEIKHSRFTYDNWKCMKQKNYKQVLIENDLFQGYGARILFEQLSKPQYWMWRGKKIKVCEDGGSWIMMIPAEGNYAITWMLDKFQHTILWYIDMLDGIGLDRDGVVYGNDIFLDLIVDPSGYVKEDDREEMERAFAAGVINQSQKELAEKTAKSLKNGLLKDVDSLLEWSWKIKREIEQSKESLVIRKRKDGTEKYIHKQK